MSDYSYYRSIFRFSNKDGYIRITGLKTNDEVVQIPAQIGANKVARLKPLDFWDCSSILIQSDSEHECIRNDKPYELNDVVNFGVYIDYFGNNIPLKWVVVDVFQDSCILITEKPIDVLPYNKRVRNHVSWSDSHLRAWLNGPFYGLTFNADERAQICQTEHFDLRAGTTVCDNVFILDAIEAEKYLINSKVDRTRTEYLEKRGAAMLLVSGTVDEWLRSEKVDRYNAFWQHSYNFYGACGCYQDCKECVRPAVRIKYHR